MSKKNKMKFRIDLYALKSAVAKCNLTCGYCHLDYFAIPGHFDDSGAHEISELISLCLQAGNVDGKDIKLHYSGRAEPLLLNKDAFISETQKLKLAFPDAEKTITTNGIRLAEYAEAIQEAGITKVNVSHHNYSETMERRVLEGIRSAKSYGLDAGLNVVATEDVTENLERFIKLGDDNSLTLKFFNLIADDKNYTKHLFEEFLRRIEDFSTDEIDHDIDKNRIRMRSHSGNLIVIKLEEKFTDRPDECLQCEKLQQCDESCWDTIRITPWYIRPCGVREDNIYMADEMNAGSLRNKLLSGGKLTNLNILQN